MSLAATSDNLAPCPVSAAPCANASALQCFNGGRCCQTVDPPITNLCACVDNWTGAMCHVEDLSAYEKSQNDAMQMISLSFAISITVGIIALVALGIITLVIVRNSKATRPWGFGPLETEPDLDTTIIYVQEEIAKLPTAKQLNKLQRLSKLFEKTVRNAILSVPGDRTIDRPKSVVMNDYLPRWSSAPSCIDRPPPNEEFDVTDGGDGVYPKPKLQGLFSLQGPVQSHRATAHL